MTTSTYDWSRVQGDRHEAFSGQITETTEDPDTQLDTTGPFDLTAKTLSIRFVVVSPNDPDLATSLEEACVIDGDPTLGNWHYAPSASFAALSSGIVHSVLIATYGDGTTKTFPDDPAQPYQLGYLIPALRLDPTPPSVRPPPRQIIVGPDDGADINTARYLNPADAFQVASDRLAANSTPGGNIVYYGQNLFDRHGLALGDYVSLEGVDEGSTLEWVDGCTFDDPTPDANFLVTTGLWSIITRAVLHGNAAYGCPLPIANDGSNVNTYTPTGPNTLGGGLKAAHARNLGIGLAIESMAERGMLVQGVGGGALAAHAIQAAHLEILGCGGIGLHLNGFAYDGEWLNTWIGSCATNLRVEFGNGENSFRNAHLWGAQHNNAELAAPSTRFHGQVESAGGKGMVVSANGCQIESGTSVWGNGRSALACGVEFASANNCKIDAEIRDNNGEAILLSGTTTGVRGAAGGQVNDRLAAFQSSGLPQTFSDGAGSATVNPTIFSTANTSIGSLSVIRRSVVIAGAGAAGGTLTTTVVAVNPGVSVTLADPILTTVSGATFRYAAVTYGIRETDTATGNLFIGWNIPSAQVINARTSLSSGSLELDFTSVASFRGLLSVPAYTRSTFSNADVTLNNQQQYMGQTGTLSAPRLVNLAALSTVASGQPCEIADESGTCSSSNTLTVTANGTDRIKDGASVSATYVLNGPCKSVRLRAIGGGRWLVVSAH